MDKLMEQLMNKPIGFGEINDSHGSPFDRGRSDAYYGRGPNPHMWYDSVGATGKLLTDREEIDEYMYGYNNESDRKAWGHFGEY